MTHGRAAGVALLVIILGLLALTSCQTSQADARPVKPTWIKPEVASNTVYIPVSEVERNRMSHFSVGTAPNDMTFMAYVLDGKTQVRADICPPCRSESFSLKKTTLVCDACGTIFDAQTGKGIQGPCVAYPKAAVQYQVIGGKMMLKVDDLVTAYRNTLKPRLS